MSRGEIANPILVAGQIIHLHREADGELRELALRPADFLHVFVELPIEHAPVIEIIARHRRVIGETNFGETQLHGAAGVIHRLAAGVAAERRVHVIIRRQLHGGEC